MKYLGQVGVKDYKNAHTNGKLSKLALRNIFRDSKRARVVLLSLSLGLTLFIGVTLIVSSINVEQSLERVMRNSDFIIEDLNAWNGQQFNNLFDDEFLNSLNTLSTIEEVQTSTYSPIVFTYQPAFDPYIDELVEFGWIGTRDDVATNLSGRIYPLNGDELSRLNDTLDVEAFERGEFAVILTDQADIFADLEQVEVQGAFIEGNKYEQTGNSFTIPVGGFVSDSTGWFSSPHGYLVMFVSHSFFEEWREEEPQFTFNIRIDSVPHQEAYARADLEDLFGADSNVKMLSRAELQQDTESARLILFFLGGGISLILAGVGLMNFINSMSMGIIVRKRELATLESIGMTRKQLQKMLIFEGLWYGMIILLLVATVGNGVAIGAYLLISNGTTWGNFMVFNYPIIPTIAIVLVVLIICTVTPSIIYRLENKASLVEKLREVE